MTGKELEIILNENFKDMANAYSKYLNLNRSGKGSFFKFKTNENRISLITPMRKKGEDISRYMCTYIFECEIIDENILKIFYISDFSKNEHSIAIFNLAQNILKLEKL